MDYGGTHTEIVCVSKQALMDFKNWVETAVKLVDWCGFLITLAVEWIGFLIGGLETDKSGFKQALKGSSSFASKSLYYCALPTYNMTMAPTYQYIYII